ncbi:unnamed protein product [Adineta ricciae]|uniref:ATP-dependent DNA helicase n=1 Tax=Adineta ricciae TaxID=249248 RepID=A0A815VLV7_ADIRI|nr:unnamed protein product [Adineta ricciae]CAF1529959.1 unnamed protein product [Adineta ricciae]
MPLVYSSRGFVFVPSHSNSCRFLKSREALQQLNPNDQNIYMSNLADKYFDRPFDKEFDICMADFASNYEIFAVKRVSKNPRTPIKYLRTLNFAVKKRVGKSAIIRFPHFHRENDTENYFENLLSLYLPIRNRNELKKPYELFYEEGEMYDNRAKCNRKVKDIVCENRKKYEAHFEMADELKTIFDDFSTERKEDEWASIVCNSEKNRQLNEEIICENNPDFDMLRYKSKKNFLTNLKQMFRGSDEMRPLLECMNEEQQKIFYYVRNWCLRRLHNSSVEPLRLFITGGAGTGKSHLLKCLQYEATRIFARKKHLETDENIDLIHTLITAYTGAAAVNVGGVTIHSAFGLSIKSDRLRESLSCEKLNSYRCKLGSLKLLFIDEISLVPVNLWGAIHARLGQIMGIQSNTVCFGNIGIITIGDFYQCPPVGSCSIYNSMLWIDHFEMTEMNTNERQKECGSFSEMLNRIRKLKKKEEMIKQDRNILEKCHQRYLNKEYSVQALHLFAKNIDVDEHNNEILDRICNDIKVFYEIDKKGNQVKLCQSRYGKILHAPLRLAKDARIMITNNICVADGLANGVTGRIVDFIENKYKEIVRIVIKCDSPSAGTLHRTSCQHCHNRDTVCVERNSENDDKYENSSTDSSLNKQFPLKLSWAMTIHKAQGLTVDELILSTKDLFGCGMGYTGLSRNKRIESLFLKDLHLEKFYCDPNVDAVLSQMKRLKTADLFIEKSEYLNILFHNIEGLQSNIVALRSHYLTKKAAIICLAETWEKKNNNDDDKVLEIEGYQFLGRTRFDSYKDKHPLKLLKHGGVGVYYRNDIQIIDVTLSEVIRLEYIMIESIEKNVLLIVCYRSPQQEKKEFLKNLKYLLKAIDIKKRILIIGDLNGNSLSDSNKTISKGLHDLGFINIFDRVSTTNDQTSIDCIHTNFISKKSYFREVSGSFYSYHEPICISVDLNGTPIDITKEIETVENIDLKI